MDLSSHQVRGWCGVGQGQQLGILGDVPAGCPTPGNRVAAPKHRLRVATYLLFIAKRQSLGMDHDDDGVMPVLRLIIPDSTPCRFRSRRSRPPTHTPSGSPSRLVWEGGWMGGKAIVKRPMETFPSL